jgi:hypothetical protein
MFAGAIAVGFLALSLAGCATVKNIEAGAQTAVGADLLSINTQLAKTAPSVAAFVSSKIMVADGYFQQIAATGALSQTVIAEEAAAVTEAKALVAQAGSSSTSVSGVASELAQIFTDIQNLSQVPGT